MLKICKKCHKKFQIRDEDLLFYDKISPIFNKEKFTISSPTLCPICRSRRRLVFRNERNFYKRKSDLSGKDIISIYDEKVNMKIFSKEEWWQDDWNPLEYGRNFDYNMTFFDQFSNLRSDVPTTPLINNQSDNSDYCNFADQNKNCYILTTANKNIDSLYSFWLVNCNNVVDSAFCTDSELIYEGIDIRKSYNLRFCQNCENCSDSLFLLNCRNLKNSIFCINAENKEYFIFNRQSAKEEYENLMKNLDGSRNSYNEFLHKFVEMKEKYPVRKSSNISFSDNCIGERIYNSKNVYHGFEIYDSLDLGYCNDGLRAKDCFDICFFDQAEFCYESNSLIGYGFRFCNYCRKCQNIYYCDNCHNCHDLFGCIGLRNKSYCIFNRQYTKEDYEKLAGNIVKHMKETEEWGEFFPEELSPFFYNQTLANDYLPLEKETAIYLGFKWLDLNSNKYNTFQNLSPDNISNVTDEILSEIITCEKTGKNYKIVPQELKFYRNMKLPIPIFSPDYRHGVRMSKRKTLNLFKRNCQKCNLEVKSVYSEEDRVLVYCDKCYLHELL